MKSRAKGTGRFGFKESRVTLQANPKQPYLLYLWFTYGEKRFKISTGFKVAWEDWDPLKERVRNRIHILDRDRINDDLSELLSRVYKIYNESYQAGTALSIGDFKSKLQDENESHKEGERLDFFEVIQQFLAYKQGSIKQVTLRSYSQTVSLLSRYQRGKRQPLSFENIDRIFYKAFKNYLEKEGYSLNTIGKHIKNFKTFCNYALTEGYTNNRKFKRPEFKAVTEETTKVYLTEEELSTLFHLDLSSETDLELARDIFLIGCYTGQRVSDYNGLKTEQVVEIDRVRYFRIRQSKNFDKNKVVLCPITSEIAQIMSRYGNEPPPFLHEQDLNDRIKVVCAKAGISELVTYGITLGGSYNEQRLPKHKLIQGHTARRSFCTNMYKKGMPTYDIMLFSGHTTEKEFYKYIRIAKEQRAHALVNSGLYFNL